MSNSSDKTDFGIIIKGIGGFYYVETAERIYECRARGILRKNGITPLAGDNVKISIPKNSIPMVDEVTDRKNFLIRPPVANLKRLFVVVSMSQPVPSTLVIDRIIALAENKNIEPIVVITKTDLAPYDEIYDIYSKSGFKTIVIDYQTGGGLDEVKALLMDGINAFAGNSGAGKSTLINAICPDLKLKTADISEKLGRGRHTTREAELFDLPFGKGKIADTPGFSSLDFENSQLILKDQLPFCFREFEDYIGGCRFTSCTHTVEKGCAVLEAVKNGDIPKSRHESYVTIFNEVKNIKNWEIKNR